MDYSSIVKTKIACCPTSHVITNVLPASHIKCLIIYEVLLTKVERATLGFAVIRHQGSQ